MLKEEKQAIIAQYATHEGDTGSIGEAIKEKEAKDLLMHCDYEAYTKYFGTLEEA